MYLCAFGGARPVVESMGLCYYYNHAKEQADYVLMGETPEMHAAQSMARFIEQEVGRPSKQWICSIIEGNQEQDEVVHRTEDYVLLPDTERANRYWRITHNTRVHHSPARAPAACSTGWPSRTTRACARSATCGAATRPCCRRCSTPARR